MPDVQNLESYDFKENPFMAILRGQGQQQPQRPMMEQGQGAQQQAQGMMGAMRQGAGMPQNGQEQGQVRQPNAALKPLISATQSLERFIAEQTQQGDMESVSVARAIMKAIARLLEKNMDDGDAMDQQAGQPIGQPQQPIM